MNIFRLADCPKQSAIWMVDKHIVKMVLESAQLLSTAHRVLDGCMLLGKSNLGRSVKRYILPDARNTIVYQAAHINHPSAVWTRETSENYLWLYDHYTSLLKEYTHRYHKHHKSGGVLCEVLAKLPINIAQGSQTVVPSAMDAKYKISSDPIINYRYYYTVGKATIHSWRNREQPEWIEDFKQCQLA